MKIFKVLRASLINIHQCQIMRCVSKADPLRNGFRMRPLRVSTRRR